MFPGIFLEPCAIVIFRHLCRTAYKSVVLNAKIRSAVVYVVDFTLRRRFLLEIDVSWDNFPLGPSCKPLISTK